MQFPRITTTEATIIGGKSTIRNVRGLVVLAALGRLLIRSITLAGEAVWRPRSRSSSGSGTETGRRLKPLYEWLVVGAQSEAIRIEIAGLLNAGSRHAQQVRVEFYKWMCRRIHTSQKIGSAV